jgi:hypothetical protein
MNVKKIGAVVATVALVLGLSGCVRVISDVTLHENNTASGEMIVAVQEGIGASMGMTDQDFADQLNADSGTDTMVNAKVTPYKQDGYVGTRITFSDEPLESFTGVDGTITREGDTFVFAGTAPDTSQTQDLPEGSGAIATMSITFPGKVTEHNGTLKGNTVTWDLLTQTEAAHATGSAIGGGGASSPVAVIIIAAAAIAALVIVGIVLLKRRKGGSPADGASPADDAPPADEAPPAAKPKA